jgi:hypothetical protein
VDRTFCTGGFIFLKWAAFQPPHGIIQQFLARWTQNRQRAMMILAVQLQHSGHCFLFTHKAGMLVGQIYHLFGSSQGRVY